MKKEKINNLTKLKNKLNLNEDITDKIKLFAEKLVKFGYVINVNKVYNKLYNSIDHLIISNENFLDYKTGYYNAKQKELYLKDSKNIESVFLRLLYAYTSKENLNGTYNVGYSTVSLSNKSYKLNHTNFGINRAIMSNLTCRLLYTLPATLEIVPTYRTYTNNFLGHKITTENDLYFLEGILLRQICFALNINEENFYTKLFLSSSSNYINKLISKYELKEILDILDIISRKNSNYNKLCYLNNLLTDNYLLIKKHILDKEKIKKLEETEMIIKRKIKDTLEKMDNELTTNENEVLEDVLETSISERINDLEETLIINIAKLQELLVERFIKNKSRFSDLEYVYNLRKLEKLLVLPSPDIKNEIKEVILNKIIKVNNNKNNLNYKIKYSILNYLISFEKYYNILDEISFNIIEDFDTNSDDILVYLDGPSLHELLYITELKQDINDITNNVLFLVSTNLNYLLNIETKKSSISLTEKLFTNLTKLNSDFNSLSIDNCFLYNINNNIKDNNIILLTVTDKINIIYITKIINNEEINFNYKILKLSDKEYLLNKDKLLPTLYNNNKFLELFNFKNLLAKISNRRK